MRSQVCLRFQDSDQREFLVVSGGCGQKFRRAWQATARICEFTLPPSSRYCQCLHLYNQPLQQSHKPVSFWSNTNTHTTVPYYNNLLFVSETDVSLLVQQSWVRESQEDSTLRASCATTAVRTGGPISPSRSAIWVPFTSRLPSVVRLTPRASFSRRSVSRPSSPTLPFGSASGFS